MNLGWRQVPGEGEMLGEGSVVDVVGFDVGVRTSAVVVAMVHRGKQANSPGCLCLEWEGLPSSSGLTYWRN